MSFGKNIRNVSFDDSLSIEDQIEDLHFAFRNNHIKSILCLAGGYNSNQLLKKIDYDLIKENPKIICGFSDNTAILNVITAKTKLVTYYGINFKGLACNRGLNYTLGYFRNCLMDNEEFTVLQSKKWFDDEMSIGQENCGPIIVFFSSINSKQGRTI